MWNRHRAGFAGMLELVMAAANSDKSPTVCLKRPYQITAFHGVYYTHHYRIAATCAGKSNAARLCREPHDNSDSRACRFRAFATSIKRMAGLGRKRPLGAHPSKNQNGQVKGNGV